jgi:hypothetical protein
MRWRGGHRAGWRAVAGGAVVLAAWGAWAAGGDGDGDGVPDAEDDCPQVAGPAPTGCPKKDTDGDGLWDGVDSCPLEAEDFNGIQDDDGCPDDPDLVEQAGAVVTRAPYVFPKGRIAAPRDAQNAARAVARWMKTDPRAQRVEVVVVADPSEGKKAAVELLARDRAESMAVVLGAAGVRSESILTRIQWPAKKGVGPRPRTVHLRILLGTGPRPQVRAGDGGEGGRPAGETAPTAADGTAAAAVGGRDAGLGAGTGAASVKAKPLPDAGRTAGVDAGRSEPPDGARPKAKPTPDAGRTGGMDAGRPAARLADAGGGPDAARSPGAGRGPDAAGRVGPVADAGRGGTQVARDGAAGTPTTPPTLDAGPPPAPAGEDAGRPKPPPPPTTEELLTSEAESARNKAAQAPASADGGPGTAGDGGAGARLDAGPPATSPPAGDDWDKGAWDEGAAPKPGPAKGKGKGKTGR